MSVTRLPYPLVMDIYNDEGPTYKQLAQKYGVSIHQVVSIKNGQTYYTYTQHQLGSRRIGRSSRKLTDNQVREIARSAKTHPELALEFGVSRNTICRIKYGKTGRNLVTRVHKSRTMPVRMPKVPPLPEHIPVKERLRIAIAEFFG